MSPPSTTLLARFQRLFRGRETVHGQWVKDNVKTFKEPATDAKWQLHLKGEGPFLGIVPVRLDNTCYWGAIDIDDDATDHAALSSLVALSELPLVVCRSKSGGAHLYLFLAEPVPAATIQTTLRTWASALGFSKNHDNRPIEVFPKNAKLKPGDTGNWINLPYYGNGKTNRYAVTPEGATLTLIQFLDLAESRLVSEAKLAGITPKNKGGRFADGPPCLQTLDQVGYPDGSRNMGLYNVGIYLKLAFPTSWAEDLATYNDERMDPPLKPRDVQAVVRSLEQKDYTYKCDDLPIQPHCKKTACKKQAYGVDVFKTKAKMSHMPKIADLKKVLTDPPRWLVTVDEKELDLQTDELMSLAMFRKMALERCSIIVPMLKGGEWDMILVDLLKNHTTVVAPDDAGTYGQFRALLSEFLMRRFNASTMDDVVAGLPFEPEGEHKIYFRAADLSAFLDRKKFRAFDPGKLFTALRELKAGYKAVTIKGVKVQVWSIPVPKDEQQQALDLPPQKTKRF